jgi:hypothetical protein
MVGTCLAVAETAVANQITIPTSVASWYIFKQKNPILVYF